MSQFIAKAMAIILKTAEIVIKVLSGVICVVIIAVTGNIPHNSPKGFCSIFCLNTSIDCLDAAIYHHHKSHKR